MGFRNKGFPLRGRVGRPNHVESRVGVWTTVTWGLAAGARHTVVAADGSFDSGEPVVSDGLTFAHTVVETGTWEYHCEPHVDVGMKRVVVVEA